MPSRVLVLVGTRPEAVKLAPVVRELRAQPWAECRVVATAQHRALLDQTLGFFGIRPDVDLDLMRPDQPLADLTARLLQALDPVFAAERPDCVIAQGDTTTVLAGALAAFYRAVPFAHVEAGLRTGNLARPFPEEGNRRVAASLAAVHFAPTAAARDHLLREGVPPAAVHVVGNPVVDALLYAVPRVDAARFRPPAGRQLVLATAHRREHFGAPFAAICAALRTLADRDDVQVLLPVHPNPHVAPVAERLLGGHPRIVLSAPLDYPAMVAAMSAAKLILTDSGGVQEEAPSLGVPVLVLRDETERPEGIAAGVARLVGTDPGRIVREAAAVLDAPPGRRHGPFANPYGDGRSAAAIAAVLRARFAAGDGPGRSG